ncbi:MAG: RNA polymerase sigma factor [Verrucomicrobia bacterium]|nr:RNA polymerase sigma factor [Verrucomicrobiota bacterium]
MAESLETTAEPSEASMPPTSPTPGSRLPPEFSAVYAAHSQPIYYLALRLLGDPVQAQDAVHDVFLKAFRNFAGFRGDSEVRTWLYRITLNHCSNLRQSWSARNIHTAPDDALFDQMGGDSPNPLRVLETKELGERIQRALDGLSPEYRLLLLLVADQELSYEQVGDLTRQTADAVRGKLHRARKAFTLAFAKTA